MTITAKIGRIGFTERGAWVDTIDNYRMNDLVHHNNGIWRCIVEGTRREPSNITPDWILWVQGLSNTNASGISFNPATTHLTATNMQTAAEQLARAATTTVQGLGRTATVQEIEDRAFAGNVPAYVTAADLPAIPTNRATTAVFGQVRLATQEEVNNRTTVGNTPAVVTPEQIPTFNTGIKAENVSFDPTLSGLPETATNMQEAIEEINTPENIQKLAGTTHKKSSPITWSAGTLVTWSHGLNLSPVQIERCIFRVDIVVKVAGSGWAVGDIVRDVLPYYRHINVTNAATPVILQNSLTLVVMDEFLASGKVSANWSGAAFTPGTCAIIFNIWY